jgi:hypothetical protein
MAELNLKLNRKRNGAPFFKGGTLTKSESGIFLLSIQTLEPIQMIYMNTGRDSPFSVAIELFRDHLGDDRMTELCLTLPEVEDQSRVVSLKYDQKFLIIQPSARVRDTQELHDQIDGHRILVARTDDTAFVLRPKAKSAWKLVCKW